MLSGRNDSASLKPIAKLNQQKVDKSSSSNDAVDYKQPRTLHFEFFGPHFTSINLIMLPVVVLSLFHFCDSGSCPNFSKPIDINLPTFQTEMLVYLSWIAFHLVLYIILPGQTVLGSKTPDGQRLKYKINGMSSLAASLALLAILYSTYGIAPFLWINDHFFSLSVAGILFTTSLSVALYIASFRSDKVVVAVGGNSGYIIYDFWMGRELNPRIMGIDLKFLFELRPGWMILNLSFAAKQYLILNRLTNSMVLVNIAQGYYILDALLNEKAILTTMDIVTDGFGFMLCFGDLVWVPFTYSLQARYLSMYPLDLSFEYLFCIVVVNLLGLYIFRSANSEKNAFRTNPKDPSVSHLKFITTEKGSKLLVTGWWGVARKINYTGDWLMALAWCLPCGSNSIVPYFYAIYFAILLIHRAGRDDDLCRLKYGKDWDLYKRQVPYKFIPRVL